MKRKSREDSDKTKFIINMLWIFQQKIDEA